MSEIVIRITVPDGTTVRVDQGSPDFEHEPLPPEPNGATSWDAPAAFPPFGTTSQVCPVHHVAWKTVPAGVSRKTGKPYNEFKACPEQGCNERP